MDVLKIFVGELANVVIPRPQLDGIAGPGVGKVFLEYADNEGAVKARAGMNGRRIGGNQVVAIFYPENKFYLETTRTSGVLLLPFAISEGC